MVQCKLPLSKESSVINASLDRPVLLGTVCKKTRNLEPVKNNNSEPSGSPPNPAS